MPAVLLRFIDHQSKDTSNTVKPLASHAQFRLSYLFVECCDSCNMCITQGKAGQCRAAERGAGQAIAGQGKGGQGERGAGQSRTGHCRAGQGRAG